MRSYRFDLDTALAAWRATLTHNRTFTTDDLDELEQHLRDQVTSLVAEGLDETAAYRQAVREMGDYATAEREYRKVYWSKRRRRHELLDDLSWRLSMLKNYLKIAFRTWRKQKGYAFINIFGLAVGLTCFILISLFVQFELSYDRFHEKADRTYRIAKENPGSHFLGTNQWARTPAPLVKALMEEFPEVEHSAQIDRARSLLEYDDKRFYEEGLFSTEHFFDVFSFRLLHGDPRTALRDPQSIFLTESLAEKYFGDANPMGQTLAVAHAGEHFNGKNEMQVAGILEDVPANSHLSFDYVVSVASSPELVTYLDRWGSNSYLTYVSLRPDHSRTEFAAKLRTLAQEHLDERGTYYPQALTDIHLHSHINGEFRSNGDIMYVYLYSAIAVLIVLIACINYINLATARSVTRTKEVGVRKVMGAHRRQLIGQFMSEAILPSVFALLIAVTLVPVLLPLFNELTARPMVLDFSQNGDLLMVLLLVGLGAGILAGSYPALMMSSFHPVGMMKGVLKRRAGKTRLRNVLVVVQFSITIVLIVGTLVIGRQLRYIQSANTGVDRHQVVSIDIKDRALYKQYATLKQTLQSHPNVLGVTAAQTDPTRIHAASRVREWEGAEEGQSILVYRSAIQHDFVDVFGLELAEGRDFSEFLGATEEREGLLINETLKRQLGWETAVGRALPFRGRDRVIGVLRDFNFLSFHQEMAPLALYIEPEGWFPHQRIFVKVGPDTMQETIAFLSETMAEFLPEYPFVYHFLDDAYNRMYQTEIRLGRLFSSFTVLALVIACLGLLGLAAFTSSQRAKEIGVRKVLGASFSDILVLLSRDFTRLVVIAFVLGSPVAYFAMNTWLAAFAYRTSLGWGTFIAAGAAVLVVAWLTVSYQTIRAARMNPVKSLRYE